MKPRDDDDDDDDGESQLQLNVCQWKSWVIAFGRNMIQKTMEELHGSVSFLGECYSRYDTSWNCNLWSETSVNETVPSQWCLDGRLYSLLLFYWIFSRFLWRYKSTTQYDCVKWWRSNWEEDFLIWTGQWTRWPVKCHLRYLLGFIWTDKLLALM